MMTRNSTILIIALILTAGLGCSKGGNAAAPGMDGASDGGIQAAGVDSHRLLSFNYVFVDASDPGNITWEVVPVRDAAKHWNILTFLENGPCTNCFKLAGITPSGSGTFYVDVEVKSPYPSANLTGFDVRGIAMFNASAEFPMSGLSYSDRDLGDGAVVAPDGYTTLYNSTTLGSGFGGLEGYRKGKYATTTAPDALLNPYMRFITDDPSNTRNAFYAGDTVTATYEVAMPTSGFIFGYAVDASWAQPIHKPVTDPMADFGPDANCAEPWKIDASSSHIGPWGNADVTIDVYDWQGKASHKAPILECPDLFDGEITATFEVTMPGFSRYGATVNNDKSAADGTYKCLVSVEDNSNDPVGKPWLDLTAYQVIDVVVSPEFNLTEITPPWLNGGTQDYEIDGNLLYVSSGFSGIQVFDITDPANPQWVTNVPIGFDDITYDLTIANGYLYTATFGEGVVVVDIDPLEDAHVVNTIDVTGAPFAIDSSGTTLYAACATYPDGIVVILDASDPTSPTIVNSVPFSGFPREIKESGGYAYLAANTGGLVVLDVDPAASASVVATVPVSGESWGVDVSGTYAYVATRSNEFDIIDINPPESASIVKTVSMPSNAYDVSVAGDYAYVAVYDAGVQIVDINPPDSASIIKTVSSPFWLKDCLIEGDNLFAGTECGTMVINITDPLSATTEKVVNYPGMVWTPAAMSDRVIVANADGGTIVVDTSEPASATVINVIPTGLTTDAVTVGNHGYVMSSDALQIIDLTTPGSETVMKSIPIPSGGSDLRVAGGYAYIASGSTGLTIYDVDPPDSASLVGTAATTYLALSVGVQAGYAYVGMTDYTNYAISVIDVDPPGSAGEILTLPLTYAARDFAFSGDYAFVANDVAGLTVVDISSPPSSSVVGSTDLTGTAAMSVKIQNNFAFVLDYSEGLVVVDVSDPLAPVEKTSLNVPGYKYGLDVLGDTVYIGVQSGGLRIVRLW